uniref:Ig-like domain-containing protein n=1 Tax=Oryzias melastigma TaxID=30732 RepID=A0A3B3BNX7_ORYME
MCYTSQLALPCLALPKILSCPIIITAESGDDVTLRCEDTEINQIFLLEWTKPNLQGEETVFLYRNDGILLDQDKSFRNRVFLNNSQMKDGDLSVVLENVTIEDSGTYQCRQQFCYLTP